MAVDDTLIGVHFTRGETHFVGVVVAARSNARKDFAHLGFVVDELQERLAARTFATDAEYVFGGRVQVDNQQTVIEQDDARGKTVEDVAGVLLQWSVAGTAAV